jgi:hypothetical protein
MFSEKFYVSEKYNLSSKEHIGTYEHMFLEFTSFYDEIYKPDLDQGLTEKFKKILNYKFNNNTTKFNEESTFFGIYYSGDNVLQYEIQVSSNYNLIRPQHLWDDFVSTAEIAEISHLKPLIEEKISKTDSMTNKLSDMIFDSNGQITGIGIYDVEYKKTVENSDINVINDFSNSKSTYKNFLIFNVDGTYKSIFTYDVPIMQGSYAKTLEDKNLIEMKKCNVENYNLSVLDEMIAGDLLNQEEVDFIKSHLSGNRLFSIEFDIDQDERITNKVVEIITHSLFEEL